MGWYEAKIEERGGETVDGVFVIDNCRRGAKLRVAFRARVGARMRVRGLGARGADGDGQLSIGAIGLEPLKV